MTEQQIQQEAEMRYPNVEHVEAIGITLYSIQFSRRTAFIAGATLALQQPQELTSGAQTAVDFVDWVEYNGYYKDDETNKWTTFTKFSPTHTTAELFTLFQQRPASVPVHTPPGQ